MLYCGTTVDLDTYGLKTLLSGETCTSVSVPPQVRFKAQQWNTHHCSLVSDNEWFVLDFSTAGEGVTVDEINSSEITM